MSRIFDSVPPAVAPKEMHQEPPCPACCGEGYVEVLGGPGFFSEIEECWMPSDDALEPCTACRGSGVEEAEESIELEEPTGLTDHEADGAERTEPALPF